jgi:hypothetical protein
VNDSRRLVTAHASSGCDRLNASGASGLQLSEPFVRAREERNEMRIWSARHRTSDAAGSL